MGPVSNGRAGSTVGSAWRGCALGGLLLALAAPASAQHLAIGGRAEAEGDRLRVLVALANRSGAVVRDVSVLGELDGNEASNTGAPELAAGAEEEVPLLFPNRVSRPGLHSMILRLAFHSGPRPDDGEDALLHQVAYLSFPLGARPEPAVVLRVPPVRVGWSGRLDVEITPRDGVAHTLALRVLTAPGLAAYPARREVELPPGAPLRVPFRLLRGSGGGSLQHGALVEARVLDGPLERSVVAIAEVELSASRGWLPGHRSALLALAAALLLAALVVEVRRHRRG